MKRLLAMIRWDIQLQYRQGFYIVSAFVAVVIIILLKQLPPLDWARVWPVIILENLVVHAFYLNAGLVLLEKGEGTLEAMIVTPMRTREYLISKVVSLGVLSLFETLLIVVAVTGAGFNWLLLVVGIMLLIAFYALYGFFVVARYDSISDFILPSVAWTIWFSLPVLYFLDFWTHWLFFLHPLQAPLGLMQGAFEQIPVRHLLYGLGYSALWVVIAYFFSQRAFRQFIVTRQGLMRSPR